MSCCNEEGTVFDSVTAVGS